MKYPFTQKEYAGRLIREFSKDVNSSELVWHRDRYDREVKVVAGRGWQLQLENKLPQTLKPGVTYRIPARTYHRVIKGTTKLVVEIKENKLRITRRQLRKMVSEKIAHPRHGLGKNIADADFPIVVRYSDRSEIAYDQDELDNILDMITGGPGSSTNIPYSLDSLEDMEPKDRPVGADIERFTEGKMKITRRQLRRIIKESLLREAMDPVQQILQWAEEGNRVTVGGKNIWPGLGNRSGLHSYGDELISKKWAKSGDRFAKKVESLPPGTEVELKRFKNINRDRGRWVTAGTVTTVASSTGSGEQPSRPVLKMIYELLGFLKARTIGASNISNISVYTKDDAPFRGKVWQVTIGGETYLFPDDKSSQELAEDTYGDGIWEIISPF